MEVGEIEPAYKEEGEISDDEELEQAIVSDTSQMCVTNEREQSNLGNGTVESFEPPISVLDIPYIQVPPTNFISTNMPLNNNTRQGFSPRQRGSRLVQIYRSKSPIPNRQFENRYRTGNGRQNRNHNRRFNTPFNDNVGQKSSTNKSKNHTQRNESRKMSEKSAVDENDIDYKELLMKYRLVRKQLEHLKKREEEAKEVENTVWAENDGPEQGESIAKLQAYTGSSNHNDNSQNTPSIIAAKNIPGIEDTEDLEVLDLRLAALASAAKNSNSKQNSPPITRDDRRPLSREDSRTRRRLSSNTRRRNREREERERREREVARELRRQEDARRDEQRKKDEEAQRKKSVAQKILTLDDPDEQYRLFMDMVKTKDQQRDSHSVNSHTRSRTRSKSGSPRRHLSGERSRVRRNRKSSETKTPRKLPEKTTVITDNYERVSMEVDSQCSSPLIAELEQKRKMSTEVIQSAPPLPSQPPDVPPPPPDGVAPQPPLPPDDDDEDEQILRSQLLLSLANKRREKITQQADASENRNNKAKELSKVKTKNIKHSQKMKAANLATSKKPSKSIHEIPQHKPVVINLAEDSSDEESHSKKSEPVAGFLGDLDIFLKEARQSVEVKTAPTKKDQTETKVLVPKTPDAIITTMSVSKVNEYRKLKEEIAKLEKQKKIKRAKKLGGGDTPEDGALTATSMESESESEEARKLEERKESENMFKQMKQDFDKQKQSTAAMEKESREMKEKIVKKLVILKRAESNVTKLREQLAAAERIVQANKTEIDKLDKLHKSIKVECNIKSLVLREAEQKLAQTSKNLYGSDYKSEIGSSQVLDKQGVKRKQGAIIKQNVKKTKTDFSTDVAAQKQLNQGTASPTSSISSPNRKPKKRMAAADYIEKERLKKIEAELAEKIFMLSAGQTSNRRPGNSLTPRQSSISKNIQTKTSKSPQKKPHDVIQKPHDVIQKPLDVIQKPHDVIQNTENSAKQPPEESKSNSNSINKTLIIQQESNNETTMQKSESNSDTTDGYSESSNQAKCCDTINKNSNKQANDGIDDVVDVSKKSPDIEPAQSSALDIQTCEQRSPDKICFKSDAAECMEFVTPRRKSLLNVSGSRTPNISQDKIETGPDAKEKLTDNKSGAELKNIVSYKLPDSSQMAVLLRLQNETTESFSLDDMVKPDEYDIAGSFRPAVQRLVDINIDLMPSNDQDLIPVPLQQYSSSLLNFRAYRFSPYFRTRANKTLTSTTYNHKMDPRHILCRFDLNGTCNDDQCAWQHQGDFSLSNEEVLQDTVSYYPAVAGVTDLTPTKDYYKHIDEFVKKFCKQNSTLSDKDRCLLMVNEISNKSGHVVPQTLFHTKRTWQPRVTRKFKVMPDKPREVQLQKSTPDSDEFDQLLSDSVINDEDVRYYMKDGESIVDMESAIVERPEDIALWLKLAYKKLYDTQSNLVSRHNLALNVLARAIEANKTSCQLWLHYLTIFIKSTNASKQDELMQLCEQSVQYAPSYDLWWLYLNVVRKCTKKDGICQKILEYLVSSKTEDKIRSHYILEILLYQVQLQVTTGKYKTALLTFWNALKSQSSITSNLSSHMVPEDRCIAWLSYIHLKEFRSLPQSLFYPNNSNPGKIVNKDPFLLPWKRKKSTNTKSSYFADPLSACTTKDLPIVENTLICMPLYRNVIQMEVFRKRYDAAKNICRRLTKSCPQDIELWLCLAQLEHMNSTPDAVRKVFTNAMNKNPHCAEITHAAVTFERSQNNHEGAIETLQTFVVSLFDVDVEATDLKCDLLYCKILNQSLPLGYTAPEINAEVDTALLNKEQVYVWLNYCELLTLQGNSKLASECYETSMSSLKSLQDIQQVWLRYLHHLAMLLNSSENKQTDFKQFSDTVRRCLISMPSKQLLPFSSTQHWQNYTFHNQVIELYMMYIPEEEIPAAYDRFLQMMPANMELIMRACEYIWRNLGHSSALTICLNYVYDKPPFLPLWKVIITLLQKEQRNKEVGRMFQRAVAVLPYAVGLWKDFLLFECTQESADNIHTILQKCSTLDVNLDEYCRTILQLKN